MYVIRLEISISHSIGIGHRIRSISSRRDAFRIARQVGI